MPLAPTLETERLILRPPRIEDASAHNKHLLDWDIIRYFASGFPWPYPENGSEKFLATITAPGPHYYWAITAKNHGDEMIGLIELRPDAEESHRSFWLGKAFHNQGLMTEALYITNDFWFETLNKDRMQLHNAHGNGASTRLKDKTGAKFLRLEPASYKDESFTQREVWELTRDAWQKFKDAKKKCEQNIKS